MPSQYRLDENVSVTPDSASSITNEDTTTQNDITAQNILSVKTQRKNKTQHTKNKKPKNPTSADKK